MPWGAHRGIALGEIPADYLLFLYEQAWIIDWPELHLYLAENEKALRQELEEDETRKGTVQRDLRSYRDYEENRF